MLSDFLLIFDALEPQKHKFYVGVASKSRKSQNCILSSLGGSFGRHFGSILDPCGLNWGNFGRKMRSRKRAKKNAEKKAATKKAATKKTTVKKAPAKKKPVAKKAKATTKAKSTRKTTAKKSTTKKTTKRKK